MTFYQKQGIVIYIFLIIEGAIASTALYMKAKRTPILYSLLASHVAVVAWLVFASIEILSVGTKYFLIAAKLSHLPIMLIGSLWFVFVLYYTGKIIPRNRKIVWVILLIPLLSYLLIWSERYQHLLIGEVIPNTKIITWGPLFYAITAAAYIYVILGSVFIIMYSLKKKTMVWQNILLIVSVYFMAIVSLLTAIKVIPTYGFDPSPITFSVVLATVSLLVFKYNAIDVIPIAYHELFNYINSAALIVDKDGNKDDYNKTFMKYFNNLLDSGPCKDIYTFLTLLNNNSDEKKVISNIKSILDSGDEPVYEVNIRVNTDDKTEKQFSISIVSLKHSDMKPIGRLIIIKDVTEYRTLTISDERRRLSNDLHDGLGNCINIISSNLEYVLKNFSNSEEVRECIETSYTKATDAFLHLRRIVEELKPIDIEKNGLLWALESMFYKLRMKDIQIYFSHHDVNDELISGMKHGEVVYFICKEAMNNAILHGRAQSITITLVQTNKELKLYIMDDGMGCEKLVRSNGLDSMEDRILALGGSFECGSPSGGGFNLRVEIPLEYSL